MIYELFSKNAIIFIHILNLTGFLLFYLTLIES
jgi:hypothetical protein